MSAFARWATEHALALAWTQSICFLWGALSSEGYGPALWHMQHQNPEP